MHVNEIKNRMLEMIKIMTAINDNCLIGKRDFTAEEGPLYYEAEGEYRRCELELAEANAHAAQVAPGWVIDAAGQVRPKTGPSKPDPDSANRNLELRGTTMKNNEIRLWKPDDNIPKTSDGERTAFNDYLVRGWTNLDEAERRTLERRALQVDHDVSGGFLVAPEEFVSGLIDDLADLVFVRKYARVISMKSAVALAAPEIANHIGDASWSSELDAGGEDTTLNFNKRALYPHPLARYLKVSKTLLRKMPAVDGWIRNELSRMFAEVEENAFLNGTGVNQPLGVMLASDNGIPASRDIVTTASGAIKSDDLWNALYSLKPAYRKGARWLFHRDAVKMIRKLKDGSGDYSWRAGIADAAPQTICGLPFDESEYMPSTFTTGAYIGLLANWQNGYWICDALDMQVQVLTELYAQTNQNGYVARKETDGSPIQKLAFARLKLG